MVEKLPGGVEALYDLLGEPVGSSWQMASPGAPCFDAGPLTEWFAPGVGLIQRTRQTFFGPLTEQPLSYRRAAPPQPPSGN